MLNYIALNIENPLAVGEIASSVDGAGSAVVTRRKDAEAIVGLDLAHQISSYCRGAFSEVPQSPLCDISLICQKIQL
jgi:hypothetical protein